jgi:hypothetical protein
MTDTWHARVRGCGCVVILFGGVALAVLLAAYLN